jgi:hypothetical protein
MSCDWNILCDTCGEQHGFDDANHQEGLMLAIIASADAIAGLVPLFEDEAWDGSLYASSYDRWRIDPKWFARHRGHKLVPIDEYDHRSNQCRKGRIECAAGYSHNCGLDADHEGPCELSLRSHPYHRRTS